MRKFVLGFSVVLVVVAIAVRRAVSPPQPELQRVDMTGKTAIVTGANTGLGKETARLLVEWGADVILTSRDQSKGEEALADIRETTGRKTGEVWQMDLSSFDSVKKFARRFLDSGRRLDVLVNNAGVATSGHVRTTKDGIEEMFQVNHLSHFLLTNMLLDVLKKSAPSRIVHVSSAGHHLTTPFGKYAPPVKNTDPDQFAGIKDYGNTKLMNILFSNELARRLKGTGVVSNACHPGLVASDFGRLDVMSGFYKIMRAAVIAIRPFLGRTPEEGARTQLYLATAPEAATISGKYFDNCVETAPAARALNTTEGEWLWELSNELTGLE